MCLLAPALMVTLRNALYVAPLAFGAAGFTVCTIVFTVFSSPVITSHLCAQADFVLAGSGCLSELRLFLIRLSFIFAFASSICQYLLHSLALCILSPFLAVLDQPVMAMVSLIMPPCLLLLHLLQAQINRGILGAGCQSLHSSFGSPNSKPAVATLAYTGQTHRPS